MKESVQPAVAGTGHPAITAHEAGVGVVGTRFLKLPRVAKELVAGGVAGALAKSSVAPLERVKILIQTGRVANAAPVSELLGRLVRVEGVSGLFRGNQANVARIVPYAAIHYSMYEQIRRAIVTVTGAESRTLHPVYDLIAGSSAGAVAVTVTYPLDLVRTRLAWAVDSDKKGTQQRPVSLGDRFIRHHTLTGQALHIVRTEGSMGLYQGLGPSVAGVLPYAGMKFFVFHSLKQQYIKMQDKAGVPHSPTERLPIHISLVCGTTAGLISQSATYPLDVVRRRMQVQGALATAAKSASGPALSQEMIKSSVHGIRVVLQEQGWRGLFAGLRINYLKVGPTTAIGFTAYEWMKDILEAHADS